MKFFDKLDPDFWAPLIIAFLAVIQIPGMMRGSWGSVAGFVFILLMFAFSVVMSLRR